MWNPREHQEEDESWEVKAFAEDTKNSLATTWPPRSYSCTFCRREFRSAQALGGHMNVHRRDRARARLHQHNPSNSNSNSTASVTPTSYYSHPTPSFTTINPVPPYNQNGGTLCYLYHFPSHHTLNPYCESPCNLLHSSISPNNLMVMPSCNGFSSYSCTSSKVVLEEEEEPTKLLPIHEEQLDLELRLGHRSTPS